MNAKKQHWTLYSITATIVLTITVQLYWNYNNYLDNKQRVKNEIQSSLDIAIDEYYTDLSKSNFFTSIDYDSINSKSSFLKDFWNEDINSSKSKVSISSIKISSDYTDNLTGVNREVENYLEKFRTDQFPKRGTKLSLFDDIKDAEKYSIKMTNSKIYEVECIGPTYFRGDMVWTEMIKKLIEFSDVPEYLSRNYWECEVSSKPIFEYMADAVKVISIYPGIKYE